MCLALAIPGRAMTVSELQTQLKQGAKLVVIDIRTPIQYSREHIAGAINIPASLCENKNLPPMGKVVVYGDGLASDGAADAAAALGKKAGITAEVLQGGLAAWHSAQGVTTLRAGLQLDTGKYISYAQLQSADPADIVLIDLRTVVTNAPPTSPSKGNSATARTTASSTSAQSVRSSKIPDPSVSLTDLAAAFPGVTIAKSPFEIPSAQVAGGQSAARNPLLVLIDSGDGSAQAMARTLKTNGSFRYVILAGGEAILARKGQSGLQRSSSSVSQGGQPTIPAIVPK